MPSYVIEDEDRLVCQDQCQKYLGERPPECVAILAKERQGPTSFPATNCKCPEKTFITFVPKEIYNSIFAIAKPR